MKAVFARTLVSLSPFILGLVASCVSATEPMPDGTRRIAPPHVYGVWWTMVESCSGRTASFSAVDWYVVPGVAQFEHHDGMVSGFWSKNGARIVIAERAMFDGGLVRHEMLHAVLGKAGHSRLEFFEQCGGTVVCLAGCIRDTGPAPAIRETVARVQPDDMVVDIAIDPLRPDRSIDDGHFRLVVTVTNPRADSVVVLLPSSSNTPPASFSFLMNSGATGLWFTEHAWDPGVSVFAPRASRRAVFDFVLADRFDGYRQLPEGTYAVQGGFGPAASDRRSFIFGQSR